MADVLHIQNTHGTRDWLAGGRWGTRHDETTELPSEKKTGETHAKKSQ